MPRTNETFTLLRADDLLALRFEIVNLRVETFSDRPPQITRIQTGLPAYDPWWSVSGESILQVHHN